MADQKLRATEDGWLTIEAPGQRKRIYANQGDRISLSWEDDDD